MTSKINTTVCDRRGYFMDTKRRFWQKEQKMKSGFSIDFSRDRSPNRVLTPAEKGLENTHFIFWWHLCPRVLRARTRPIRQLHANRALPPLRAHSVHRHRSMSQLPIVRELVQPRLPGPARRLRSAPLWARRVHVFLAKLCGQSARTAVSIHRNKTKWEQGGWNLPNYNTLWSTNEDFGRLNKR